MTLSANVPKCTRCNDTTWLHVSQGNVTAVTRCECFTSARPTFAEGVPREFHAATLENYRVLTGNDRAIAAAAAFADGDRDLYLTGGVGSGKTRLACSVLNAFHKTVRTGYFARVALLLWQLQPQLADEDAKKADALRDRLMTAPVLVLDDIGAETPSDYTRRTLLTIYEARSDAGHRTIWTSNLGLAPDRQAAVRPKTLAEFLGDDRLPSRIAGRAQIVQLTSTDQRVRRIREDR